MVDSRPAGKYAAGHIPGALSLPLDVLAKDNAAADRLGIPRTGKVIFYCAGRECTLSPDSAAIFRKLGYADTWVYRNGIPGWNQKAQPLRAEESFLRKGNLILIDTAVDQDTIVAAGSRTLQIAAADLAAASGLKLLEGLSRNAPIVVLERGDMAAVNDALEALRDQDFRRMAYFPINAWKEALAKAPAPTALSWAPVYAPGQVSPKAFEEAVASGRFILDVRPAADFARGHFKGAVNLPIEDLERDYARIPRDVPVFVELRHGRQEHQVARHPGTQGLRQRVLPGRRDRLQGRDLHDQGMMAAADRPRGAPRATIRP